MLIKSMSLNGSILIIALMTILSGCTLLPKEEPVLGPPLIEPVQAEYRTIEVVEGDIVQVIGGSSRFTSLDLTNLYFKESGGRIESRNVRLNDEVKKGDILIELDTGNIKFDIYQTEIELEKIELTLKQLREQKADQFSIDMALLDKKAIELRLQHLKTTLEQSKLRSPMDGFVTHVTNLGEGEFVESFQTIVQLADPTRLSVIYTARASESLNEVEIGMEAVISYKNKEYRGRVVQIPRDLPVDMPLETKEIYSNSVIIDLDPEDMPENVKIGDLLDVDIITQKNENTLILPRGALRTTFNGREYVQILDENSSLREVDVRTGILTPTQVEILEGLSAGDKVIVR